MARLCSVCESENRVVIDRCLASGMSLRDVEGQFQISKSALARHSEHVVRAVREAAERKRERKEAKAASVWVERLESTYESARRGAERAETDATQWPQGARFLAVATKVIETGLKADGIIDGGREMTSIHADQVLILPLPQQKPQKPEIDPEIESDVHSLKLLEDGTYVSEEGES